MIGPLISYFLFIFVFVYFPLKALDAFLSIKLDSYKLKIQRQKQEKVDEIRDFNLFETLIRLGVKNESICHLKISLELRAIFYQISFPGDDL